MDFLDVIKAVSAIVGCFLSVVSAIGILDKRRDKRFKELFNDYSTDSKKQISDIEKKLDSHLIEAKERAEEIKEIKVVLNCLDERIDDLDEKFNQVQNFCAEDCRNEIKNIYYRYNTKRKIPLYERKMADSLYTIYSEEFHQNSYGKLLYEEICKWEIEEDSHLV